MPRGRAAAYALIVRPKPEDADEAPGNINSGLETSNAGRTGTGRLDLANGAPEATGFLPQLERATVASRCPCGCASIDFAIDGAPAPLGGLRVLGDFLAGDGESLYGALIFETAGALAGIEVYGLAGGPPAVLPQPSELRPFRG